MALRCSNFQLEAPVLSRQGLQNLGSRRDDLLANAIARNDGNPIAPDIVPTHSVAALESRIFCA